MVDGPARNTCSQMQVHTITQEAMLACIHNYGKATNRLVTARHAALRQYPSNMLHAIHNKTTGHFMEMQHVQGTVEALFGEVVRGCIKELRSWVQTPYLAGLV